MDDKELYCTVLECSGFLFIFKSQICIQKLEGEWLYTSTAATLFCWCDISPIQEENLKKKKKKFYFWKILASKYFVVYYQFYCSKARKYFLCISKKSQPWNLG